MRSLLHVTLFFAASQPRFHWNAALGIIEGHLCPGIIHHVQAPEPTNPRNGALAYGFPPPLQAKWPVVIRRSAPAIFNPSLGLILSRGTWTATTRDLLALPPNPPGLPVCD